MILKSDCVHFPGDRPCRPHKETGIMCPDCTQYEPVEKKHRILIVKLDAVGDVLRTTSILHALEKAYPDSEILWLTKSSSKDFFINNPFVNEVLLYEDEALPLRMAQEKFSHVINLDPSPYSAAIASQANGDKKIGFGLDINEKVYPFNPEAIEWFEMGAFDNLKKKNKKTYQQVIHEICSLPYEKGEIVLNLTPEEIDFKNSFIQKHDIGKYDFAVGINAGASDRWEFKKWYKDYYKELIKLVTKNYNAVVLLYGGKDEIGLNSELASVSDKVIDTGGNNTMREFISLMDIPSTIITGDTLALHVATALQKEVICLFGPTSYSEIESYGRVNKIIPGLDCLVCYKNTCDFVPNCMQSISVEMVYEALKKSLRKLELIQ